jgi:hypothetical protein
MVRNSIVALRGPLVVFGVLLTVSLVCSVGCPPPTPPPPAPANPNVTCFKQFTGVPYDNVPPTVDGKLANDVGWTNAFRYVVSNGSSVPDMAMMGIRDDATNSLYLSFEVNSDPTYDDGDAVVLVFGPTNGPHDPTNDRRIIIYPLFQNAGPGTEVAPGMGAAPHQVLYYTNSGTWNSAPAVSPTPDWLSPVSVPAPGVTSPNIRVRATTTSTAPVRHSWTVEIRIPIVANSTDPGINLPAGTSFLLSWDVIRWDGSTTPNNAEEFPWPLTAGLEPSNGGPLAPIDISTPASSTWGSAIRTDSNLCNGVSIAWYDVSIVHPAGSTLGPGDIAWNQANDFTATPHNDAVDAAGNYVSSPQVFAKFEIADWGIVPTTAGGPGSPWDSIGKLSNPLSTSSTPPQDVPAAAGTTQGSVVLTRSGWTLDPALASQYQTNFHQCVRTILDAKPVTGSTTRVTFKNASTVTNMNFRQAMSPVFDTATVHTEGLRIGEQRDSVDVFLRASSFNAPPDMKWETVIAGLQQIGPGQFLYRGSIKQKGRISTSVLPPPVAIPSIDLKLPAGTPREGALRVPTRPGSLITLLTTGSIQVRADTLRFRRAWATPDGVDLGDIGGTFPLSASQQPRGRVGALIGSWDGFSKSAFFVGSRRTLKAPRGATTLSLGLNDTPDGLKEHRGEGYAIQVIQTPVADYFASHDPVITRDFDYELSTVPLGSNLPTWILCGSVKTGRRVQAGNNVADLVKTIGCYGTMLNRIRQ